MPILTGDETRLEILRLRAREADPRTGGARARADLPVARLPVGGAAWLAQASRTRGTVLVSLSRPRARVQCLLQLLRRHEQLRYRGLPERQRHRTPPNLESGR